MASPNSRGLTTGATPYDDSDMVRNLVRRNRMRAMIQDTPPETSEAEEIKASGAPEVADRTISVSAYPTIIKERLNKTLNQRREESAPVAVLERFQRAFAFERMANLLQWEEAAPEDQTPTEQPKGSSSYTTQAFTQVWTAGSFVGSKVAPRIPGTVTVGAKVTWWTVKWVLAPVQRELYDRAVVDRPPEDSWWITGVHRELNYAKAWLPNVGDYVLDRPEWLMIPARPQWLRAPDLPEFPDVEPYQAAMKVFGLKIAIPALSTASAVQQYRGHHHETLDQLRHDCSKATENTTANCIAAMRSRFAWFPKPMKRVEASKTSTTLEDEILSPQKKTAPKLMEQASKLL